MNYPPNDFEVQEIQHALNLWGKANYQDFPWRDPGELWHGLIAEILLQRTRASNVIPVYENFILTFPTPESLARATVKEIEQVIYSLGLRWRAPLLKALGERLAQIGEIPTTLDELIQLPAIGPYVAAAWLSFHGGGRGVLIDANVVRWICRMIGREYDGETRRKKWLIELADRLTPEHNVKDFNYAILDLTMTVCVPGTPHCDECPIGSGLCVYGNQK